MSIPVLSRLLLTGVFFVSPFALAQSGQGDDGSDGDEDKSLAGDKKTLVAPAVKVGSGGGLTLERKERTEEKSLFEWNTYFLWESRYVTEGRDNLSGNNLVSVSSEFIIDQVNFIPWYAYSPGVDYSELNLNFVYGVRPAEDLAVYFGYSYIHARYLDERANDNEISLDMVYKLMENVGVAAGIYHSFDVSGSFMEVSANYFDSLSKKVHYRVQGGLGVNAGYVPDGHEGLNYFQLRANTSYSPVIQTEFYVYGGYNMAIDRDAVKYAGDELLGDFFWGGIGFVYLFN